MTSSRKRKTESHPPGLTDVELPEGWVNTVLPTIANIVMGQSPPGSTYNDTGEGLPFFQGKTDFGARSPRVRKWCSAPNKIAEAGDILISVRAPVGPTNVADRECAIGRGLAAIRPLGGIPSEWILHAIRLQEPQIAAQGTGSTFTAISRRNLDAISIPLPPLAEQKRIVAKIEELLARVNAARDQLATVPAILKRFRQSVLAAACSGRLTGEWREGAQSDQWQTVALGELTELVTSGSRGWAKHYANAGAIFVRAQNLSTDRLDLSDVAHVRLPSTTEGKRTLVVAQDILVTITGANVTKTARVTEDIGEAYVNQHVALVRLKDKGLAPYVWVWLVSPDHGRSQLLDAAYGAGKPGLNLAQVRKVAIELPPLPEQHEIVRRVDELFALADTIEQHVSVGTARAEKLTQSILAKAFRGELVPTEAERARQEGRDYEPAPDRLKRIEHARHSSSRPHFRSRTKAQ